MAHIDNPQWLRLAHASQLCGLPRSALRNLAMGGQVRTRALPGTPIRFYAEDCERIRRELDAEPEPVVVVVKPAAAKKPTTARKQTTAR